MPVDRRRVLRVAVLLGSLSALLVVVGLAAGARRGLSEGEVHPAGLRALGDALVVVLALSCLAALVLWLAALLAPRQREPGDELAMPVPRAWWERLLAVTLFVVMAVLVVGVLRDTTLAGFLSPDGSASSGGLGRPGRASSPEGDVGGLDWPAIVGVVVLVVVAVVAAAVVAVRRSGVVSIPEARRSSADVLEALQAVGLDELRREPDPRRAVIRAYGAMAAILASSGLPRRASETPFEFLGRVLVGLGASAAAAARLTELFERAKFSDHPITAAFKDEAIDAVGALLSEVAR